MLGISEVKSFKFLGYIILAVLLAFSIGTGLGLWKGHKLGSLSGKMELAKAQTQYSIALQQAEEKARAQEQESARAMQEVATKAEQDQTHAQATYDTTVAALRDGTVKLRHEWAQCEATRVVPSTSPNSTSIDEDTRLREQGASNLVRYSAEADAWIKRLQEALMVDRQQDKPK